MTHSASDVLALWFSDRLLGDAASDADALVLKCMEWKPTPEVAVLVRFF
ncbi:MAG TPA: hypothetical protein VI670_27965 [Thermoanaerobaculia bacterium]|jgi:hypothetical protein